MKEYFKLFFKGLLILIVADLIIAFPFMLLWNWLIPIIFGFIEINYIQAFGILFLIRFLKPIEVNMSD